MNAEQRHFPMLREYEKAKSIMQNADLGGSTYHSGDLSKSPFGNFWRSTTGKKLYLENESRGPMPPSKLNDATKLQ